MVSFHWKNIPLAVAAAAAAYNHNNITMRSHGVWPSLLRDEGVTKGFGKWNHCFFGRTTQVRFLFGCSKWTRMNRKLWALRAYVIERSLHLKKKKKMIFLTVDIVISVSDDKRGLWTLLARLRNDIVVRTFN